MTQERKFWKITNKTECHSCFQYVDGLNDVTEYFNEDASEYLVSEREGLHFTDEENIHGFLNSGTYLREVFLPIDNGNFKMVQNCVFGSPNSWRANMITLGNRYDLSNKDIFGLIKSAKFNEQWLLYSVKNGYFDIVKMLCENGTNIRVESNKAFSLAAAYGHMEIIKYLMEKGMPIQSSHNEALRWAAHNGHLEVVIFLTENGANIHAESEYAVRWAATYGFLSIVEYLVKKGANVSVHGNLALICALQSNYLDVAKFLIENGANIAVDNRALRYALLDGKLSDVNFLIENGANIYANDYEFFKPTFKVTNPEISEFLAKLRETDPKIISFFC